MKIFPSLNCGIQDIIITISVILTACWMNLQSFFYGIRMKIDKKAIDNEYLKTYNRIK